MLVGVRPDRARCEIDCHAEIASVNNADIVDVCAQRWRHCQERLPPRLKGGQQVGGWRIPPSPLLLQPSGPIGVVVGQVAGLVRKDCVDLLDGHRMFDGDGLGADLDCRARNRQYPGSPACRKARQKCALIGENAELVASDHIEVGQVGIKKARWPGAGHHGAGIECFDVAHCPRVLTVDLGVDKLAHPISRLVVDHWVPDRAAVLQPMQIDRTVAAQRIEVGGAAIVLVDDSDRSVTDHQRRIATRAVGDAGLDMNRHGHVGAKCSWFGIDGSNDVVKAQGPNSSLEFTSWVARNQHGRVAADVIC